MKTAQSYIKLSLAIAAIMSFSAQASPDAGQTTQQIQQSTIPTLPKKDVSQLAIPMMTEANIPQGGQQVLLKTVSFVGNSVFTTDKLQSVIADTLNQAHDLAGLMKLSDRVSQFYREQGYPFARAFLPKQSTMNQGILTIEVIEGRFGKTHIISKDAVLAEDGKEFVTKLETGSVIDSHRLERAMLLLSDQAGVFCSPVMQPSESVGAGDLMVSIKRDKPYTGHIGADNFGSRYTGYNRLTAGMDINSPFHLGDQININGMLTENQMWFGGVGYNLPIGGDGLRANISYAHTYYQLGEELKKSDQKGTANIYSAGLIYALIRSQQANVNFKVDVTYKQLKDDNRLDKTNVQSTENKHSVSVPVGMNFNWRDQLFSGAVTFGDLSWTRGNLSTDHDFNDVIGAKGEFDKMNLDLARLESLGDSVSLFVRGSGQWATKNLDSSEGFGIGGATAVRAYPTGEGYGNVGWFTQTELRYQWSTSLAPYVFYDVGSSTANQTTVAGKANPTVNLSGAGAGVRYSYQAWDIDANLAWQASQHKPADSNENKDAPRAWLNLSYKFD